MNRDDLHFDGPGRYLIVIKEKVSQDIFEMFLLRKLRMLLSTWMNTEIN
jgi:hypothetical protein